MLLKEHSLTPIKPNRSIWSLVGIEIYLSEFIDVLVLFHQNLLLSRVDSLMLRISHDSLLVDGSSALTDAAYTAALLIICVPVSLFIQLQCFVEAFLCLADLFVVI